MGNPWAPPDDSQELGQRTPAHVPSQAPAATRDGAPPTSDGAPPRTPQGAPAHAPSHAPVGDGWPPAPPGHLPAPGTPGPHPVQPPDPEGVARASRTSAWTAGALLASVLLMSAPWPAMLAAPAAALAGVVLALVAVVRAARARARGSVVALPVVLLVASLVWVGLSSQTLLYVDASRDFAQCKSAALTHQAQRNCATQLETDMRERLETVFGRLGVPVPPSS
ncbi:hypothetical protein [Cellulomonas xiejunii]|uniref:DUF4190 domain-containing protein n=1 Tax=Cellulomonas xiejunii TaxID=2968083 RepID=A0ABY5KJK4_9CELL|nr:hypothetical protein [Cellulomonas xiejunii]MCC2320368.1 hypothetical protein [Cellulomonas xiejunii]UUI70667.1 hypothetical protein NP048_12785 [Cellulomonas xiejunii]